MSELISKLKGDHQTLITLLNEVKSLGPSPEGLEKLNAVKAMLLAHLALEDSKLYPELRKAATTNPQLQQTLDAFAKDMEKISAAAMDFFSKYSKSSTDLEFARDFGSLLGTLSTRISREESVLYAEFEKLTQSKAA